MSNKDTRKGYLNGWITKARTAGSKSESEKEFEKTKRKKGLFDEDYVTRLNRSKKWASKAQNRKKRGKFNV